MFDKPTNIQKSPKRALLKKALQDLFDKLKNVDFLINFQTERKLLRKKPSFFWDGRNMERVMGIEPT